MATYIIVDGDGNQLGGISMSETEIQRIAQTKANDQGRSVWYESDEDDVEAVEVEPEGIIYELIEDGYVYERGTIQSYDLETVLEAARAKARPGTRDTYMPDDGSAITVTHGVVVRGNGQEVRTAVTFEVV
jgi:hypothetical protein